MKNKLDQIKEILDRLEKKFGDNEPIKWDAYIQKVDNGFIITPPDKERSPEIIECNGDEKETMTEFLYAIYEYFCSMGIQPNKFGNENLRITWDEEGQKYESKIWEEIDEILKGIDLYGVDGWWETSHGASFGKRIKGNLLQCIAKYKQEYL